MTYKAHRDHRFEYATDVINFIEERQCVTCAFQNNRDDEFFMCPEIEIDLMTCESIEELDDQGGDGVVCRRYRRASDTTDPDPLQGELF